MTDAEQWLTDLEAKAKAIFSADQGECTLVEAQAILEDFSMAANPAAVLRLVAMARSNRGSGHVGDCDEAGQAVKSKMERLEKEADWLATAAANNGWHGVRVSPQQMREAARKAVEEV